MHLKISSVKRRRCCPGAGGWIDILLTCFSPFSELQKEALVEMMDRHFSVLKGRFSQRVTAEKKAKLWKDVPEVFVVSMLVAINCHPMYFNAVIFSLPGGECSWGSEPISWEDQKKTKEYLQWDTHSGWLSCLYCDILSLGNWRSYKNCLLKIKSGKPLFAVLSKSRITSSLQHQQMFRYSNEIRCKYFSLKKIYSWKFAFFLKFYWWKLSYDLSIRDMVDIPNLIWKVAIC